MGQSDRTSMSTTPDAQLARFRLSDQYLQLKNSFHRHLIQQIDERNLDIDRWDAEQIDRFVLDQIRRYVVDQRLPINQRESEALARDAKDELMGYGPSRALIDEDTGADIVVNGQERGMLETEGAPAN